MQYELFYLVGASREADLEKIKNDVSEIITSEGGVFEEKQTEEKRRLSYAIRHETHGTYIARRFNLEDTKKLSTITKRLNLYGNILRYLISRTDELPKLLSREERKEREMKRAKTAESHKLAEAKEKPAEKKTKSESHPKTPEKTEEDIDKKLEEILNI